MRYSCSIKLLLTHVCLAIYGKHRRRPDSTALNSAFIYHSTTQYPLNNESVLYQPQHQLTHVTSRVNRGSSCDAASAVTKRSFSPPSLNSSLKLGWSSQDNDKAGEYSGWLASGCRNHLSRYGRVWANLMHTTCAVPHYQKWPFIWINFAHHLMQVCKFLGATLGFQNSYTHGLNVLVPFYLQSVSGFRLRLCIDI
jgi:hypothetical protein